MSPFKAACPQDLSQIKADYLAAEKQWEYRVLVCGGAGCISSDCAAVQKALENALSAHGLAKRVHTVVTGCMGTCAVGPVLLVEPGNIFYVKMDPEKVEEVVARHLMGGEILEEYTFFDRAQNKHVPRLDEIGFFKDQVRIALRNCGRMEYASLPAYIARDGYFALARALTMTDAEVVAEMKGSGLRGRGGAGFPVGIKWEAGMKAPKGQKYIVCNADEGDPGAFMDRSLLEGDPHGIIEGMLIGGYAIGADKGFVYVRAEYPIAVERLSNAIGQAREAGLLGKNILGSGFSFDLEIRIGAGAFVCGEETSLLASIEGRRGEPRQKPPFPFESGLFEKPTIINNVETLANVAPIILNGAAWYRRFGTEKSAGTKVFALAGDIETAGIIEVPMGIPLGDIIYKIGGGIRGGKRFKAIQSGGPSGGCLTRAHLNTPVDYESLSALGAIMGSGGLVVMNEDTCMVDTARYFLDFIKDESCGKCLPCRTGTKRMLEILERITEGNGRDGDIEMLEELAGALKETAMCGLGQTASNPVLSTIKYFREEYETHIHDRHCAAGVCAELQTAPCRNACPANVYIPGYMALVAAGRLTDAYQLIRQENPFPAVCGRVCTHPCENHCRRAQVDEPLAICGVKRFIGDYALRDEYNIPLVQSRPATGKRVAVIGAGPSGLSCAYYLAHLGHEVDVYEAESVAGGVLYWGIPEFRLPKEVLAKEIRAIEAAGVKIHLDVKIGRDIPFEELRQRSDAVYLAVGTQKSKLLGIPGETLAGVESGLAFLRRVGLGIDKSVPKRLVVVGGGSTAMDVARSAVRLGAQAVTIVYRRTEEQMPAGAEEAREAREEGIRIIPLVSPSAIIGDDDAVCGIQCVRRALADYGKDGRRRSVEVPGSEFVIDCDGVITAVNQDVDSKFYQTTEVNVTASGALDINKFTSQTSREGIFAGGDASPWGQNVVIQAIADGKRAASNIDKYLGGTGELNKGEWIDIPVIEDNEVTEPHGRFPFRAVPPEERCDSFCEVSRGFHKLDAMGEALRCLHCERR
ncbi:NADH-quinone oxidoreductase subunit NuoF [Anaerotruncus rubiinfantis]|uniref:NADH-quinone oxidoreductase subunit NuoF n=1 Tax=Anaerotruncus rubiinfantis TaxID=1720200 RepID=UPI0034A1553A